MLLYGTISAQYTTIVEFTGDGEGNAIGGLYSDGTFLYGVTPWGGGGLGCIYKYALDGSGYTLLRNLSYSDGGRCNSSLISDGTYLYGTGTDGNGSIFKIKKDGTSFQTFFCFTGTTTGRIPQGSLLLVGNFLYGMASSGGANNSGTIFKIGKDGTGFVNLYNFSGIDGKNPNGGLVSDGIFLYGMTMNGGANDIGVLFRIKLDGTQYSKFLDFDTINGMNPYGSLIIDGGYLYGMTKFGGSNGSNGGTIFKIKTDGTGFVKIYNLTGENGGGFFPHSSLFTDGLFLFGTTTGGPGPMLCGTVFRIKKDGTEYFVMHGFGMDGNMPHGPVISDGSYLYGTTTYGNYNVGCGLGGSGVVYKLNMSVGIEETIFSNDVEVFPNPTEGSFQIENIKENSLIEVFNILGIKIFEKRITHGESIDIFSQPNGLYYLRIRNGEVIYYKTILKE